MEKLYLLRHGKSTYKDIIDGDFKRSLDENGIEEASKMALFFKENDFEIDKILCSTAYRTRETLEIILKEYEFNGNLSYKESIYASSPEILKSEILASGGDNVLLVGHNPEISVLARNILGEDIYFGTCNLAIIDMINYKLENYIRPSQL